MFFWLTGIIRRIKMTFQEAQKVWNRWVPEIKKLSDNVEKLEESLAGTDDCVLDIYSLEETHGDRTNVLEEELASVKTSVAALENHLNSLIKKMFDAVKAENVEIKKHFDLMIKRDELMMENEQSFEIVPPPNKGYNLRKGV